MSSTGTRDSDRKALSRVMVRRRLLLILLVPVLLLSAASFGSRLFVLASESAIIGGTDYRFELRRTRDGSVFAHIFNDQNAARSVRLPDARVNWFGQHEARIDVDKTEKTVRYSVDDHQIELPIE